MNLLGRAAELLPASDPERLRLVADLGDAFFESGDLARGDEVLDEAGRIATDAGDVLAAAHLRLVRVSALLLSEPERGMRDAETDASRAIALFEAAGDELGLARAWRLLSYAAWMRMNLAEHERTSLEAIKHARRAGDLREEIELVTNLVAGLVWGPTPIPELLAQTEALARDHPEDRKLQASAIRTKAYALAAAGEFDEARALARRSREILADLGMTLDEAAGSMLTGRIEILAGDLEAAERELLKGFDRLREMGDRGFASTVAAILGRVLGSMGRDDEAERYCLECAELASAEDATSQYEWRIGLAPLLIRRGETERAEALAREAVEIINTTDMPTAQGDALVCLADVLEATGRAEEATGALREALARYEAKGHAVDAARVRERLGTST